MLDNPNFKDHKVYLQVKPALYYLEKKLILQAMEEARGNQSLAARYCQISRSTLIAKLKSYDEEIRTNSNV
jgi:DNA-binding NtrC family response regulator